MTFDSNTAKYCGGAMKLLFGYSDLNEQTPTTFTNNTDLQGRTVSDMKPSYYRFSFYDIINKNMDLDPSKLEQWIGNSSLVVNLKYFCMSHKLF